jgi:hypothetical protein
MPDSLPMRKEARMRKRVLLTGSIMMLWTAVLYAAPTTGIAHRMDVLRAMLAKIPVERPATQHPPIPSQRETSPESGGPASCLQMTRLKQIPSTKGGLVVGDDTPDESVTLTGDVTINGDIVVANQGTLILDHATVTLTGNIYVVDNGSFTCNGGSLTVLSQYRYSNGITGTGNSHVTLQDTIIDTNGYNWNGSFTDNATFVAHNTTFHDALTTGLFGTATADIDASNPLEWVVDGDASLSVANSEGPFIFWPIFKDGSVGDLTFPDGANVSSFSISESDPKISGIGFSISLANIQNVWWGMMLNPGCNVTVRDSDLRTTGILADTGTSMDLSGLVNGQSYEDTVMPISGLTYHLINSSVATWNVYPWGIGSMTLKNCIIGELGATGSSTTTVNNTLIDGTGGYVFTNGDTSTTFLSTGLLSDTVGSGNSIQVYAFSSILNGDIVATDNSVILLANTIAERTPQAKKSGLVVEASITPPGAPAVDNLIPLTGNANAVTGSDLPVDFESYQVFYGAGYTPSEWLPVTGTQFRSVRNGVLGLWDTRGLTPGAYTLKLSLQLTGGDPVEITRGIILGQPSVNPGTAVFIPHIDWSDQWQSFLSVDNTGTEGATVSVYLYDQEGLVDQQDLSIPADGQQVIPLVKGSCGIAETSTEGVLFRETFVNVVDNGIAEFSLSDTAGQSLTFLLPHYAAQSLTWMGLAIMNPGATTANATLTAFSQTGASLGEATIELAPMTRTADVLEGFFDGIDRNQVVRVALSSDQPLAGLNISGIGNEKLLFTPALMEGFATGNLIVPHIANEWNTWENRLIADNTADTPESISLALYSSGTLVLNSPVTVPAGQVIVIDLNDYAGLNPEFAMVQNDSPFVALRQSYRATQQGGIAEFILSDSSATNLEFTFPAGFSGRLNWMGLAVANPGNDPSTITATAWKNGIPIDTAELSLDGHSRLADVVSGIFSGIIDLGVDRVTLNSSAPVAGLNISGLDQERLLFTVAR